MLCWVKTCGPPLSEVQDVCSLEVLKPVVHFTLALVTGPGPALAAEELQVFSKVFVVHGAVSLGLTMSLQERWWTDVRHNDLQQRTSHIAKSLRNSTHAIT